MREQLWGRSGRNGRLFLRLENRKPRGNWASDFPTLRKVSHSSHSSPIAVPAFLPTSGTQRMNRPWPGLYFWYHNAKNTEPGKVSEKASDQACKKTHVSHDEENCGQASRGFFSCGDRSAH